MKYIIFISILVFNLVCLHSQVLNGYGIVGGIISSHHTIHGLENSVNTGNRTGTRLSIFGDFTLPSLKNYLFARAELGFVQKGALFNDVHFDTTGNTANYQTTLNYFSFTPTLNLTSNFSNLNFSVFLGPSIDFLLSYNENIMSGLYESIPKSDIGGILGVGCSINFAKQISLFTELRYNFGPRFDVTGYSISKKHTIYADGTSFSNKDYEFLIGFRFGQ